MNSIYTKAVLVLTRCLLAPWQLGVDFLSGISALVLIELSLLNVICCYLRRGRSDSNRMRGTSRRGAFGLSLLLHRVVVRHTTVDL